MHSVSFFNRPVNIERVKSGVGKQRKWVSFQHTMSQGMFQPSVKMCHTWNIHFPLFQWTRSQRHIQPVFLGLSLGSAFLVVAFLCIGAARPLFPVGLWQTRAAPCSPITKLVIQPSTHHQKTLRHLFYHLTLVLCWKDLTTLLWQCPLDFPFGVGNIHEQALNVHMWIISRILGMTKRSKG